MRSTEVAYLLLTQQPRVRIPVFLDVAEVNQHRWLEDSGQWLENVDPTHLVLAGGNQVLQKTTEITEFNGSTITPAM